MKAAPTSSQIDQFKRRAKRLTREKKIGHAEALNLIARENGYANWSLLMKHREVDVDYDRVSIEFAPPILCFPGFDLDSIAPYTTMLMISDPDKRDFSEPVRALLAYKTDSSPKVVIAESVLVYFLATPNESSAGITFRAALVDPTQNCIPIPPSQPFVTQFVYVDKYSNVVAAAGAWHASELLRSVNDVPFLAAIGTKPTWYDESQHGEMFETDSGYSLSVETDFSDVYWTFSHPNFSRLRDADLLRSELTKIKPGRVDATKFHHWVARTLAVVFGADLAPIRLSPNGNAAERRDIVGNNNAVSRFWTRLLQDYQARLVVFEAKNYDDITAADFRQVYSYLGSRHHGDIGFIVSHSESITASSTAKVHFREMYRKDGLGKLVLVLPSALLAKLLSYVTFSHSPEKTEGVMTDFLDTYLTRHLYE